MAIFRCGTGVPLVRPRARRPCHNGQGVLRFHLLRLTDSRVTSRRLEAWAVLRAGFKPAAQIVAKPVKHGSRLAENRVDQTEAIHYDAVRLSHRCLWRWVERI